jgi:hypothetical protein
VSNVGRETCDMNLLWMRMDKISNIKMECSFAMRSDLDDDDEAQKN